MSRFCAVEEKKRIRIGMLIKTVCVFGSEVWYRNTSEKGTSIVRVASNLEGWYGLQRRRTEQKTRIPLPNRPNATALQKEKRKTENN
jgi:hypothetical protein